jgi:hypothetical protein
LGLASYYRRFIKDFSKIAFPLHTLLKKDAPFNWSEGCVDAFNGLKNRLVSAPVLVYPNFESDNPFILETDASLQGLGAVLGQKQSDGLVHPTAYASRSLHPNERNYGITELETLGLIWAAKLFRPYLLGHKCVVYTDHSACTSLLGTRHPSAKLARWAMIIQELDVEIKHRPGKSNTNADALSRNPCDQNCGEAQVMQVDVEASEDSPLVSDMGTAELSALQRKESEFIPILQYVEKGELPKDERQARRLVLERPRFSVIEGVLHYENPDLPGVTRIAVRQIYGRSSYMRLTVGVSLDILRSVRSTQA